MSTASQTTYDWATMKVLLTRDLYRFLKQPSRIVGALGQPIIFWFLIGTGMANTFRIEGVNIPYPQYFFPGVVMMVLLFASIFASVSIIEDRHQGFLQAVLAGPARRPAIVLGKCAGSTAVALTQAGLFLMLLPLADFQLGDIHWPLLIATLVLTSFGLTAMGFAVAWWLDSVQAYHAIQMTLLVPLWVVSGAMFPPHSASSVMQWLMTLNPITYAVDAARHAFYAGAAPLETVGGHSLGLSLGVTTLFAATMVGLAVLACQKRP